MPAASGSVKKNVRMDSETDWWYNKDWGIHHFIYRCICHWTGTEWKRVCSLIDYNRNMEE